MDSETIKTAYNEEDPNEPNKAPPEPVESKRERITPDEAVDLFRQVLVVAQIARGVDLGKVKQYLDELELHESIGPLFDPTSFVRPMPNGGGSMFDRIKEHRKLFQAFNRFRREIAEFEIKD